MGLILFIVSKILILLLYPIGFTYSIVLTLFKSGFKAVDRYFFKCAIASDQHGNVYLSKLFNDTLIKPGGHHFGHEDETISSVLGRNKLINKLTLTGRILDSILEFLDPDHSIKSIGK